MYVKQQVEGKSGIKRNSKRTREGTYRKVHVDGFAWQEMYAGVSSIVLGRVVGDAVGEAVVGDAVSVGPAMVGVAVGAWRVRIKVTPNLLLTSAIRQC